MAVTTIRKVSSYTLSAVMLISIAVFILFFMGGTEMVTTSGAATYESYKQTDPLLFLVYALFGATLLATLGFALKGFFGSLARDPKAALMSVSGVVAFVALLVVTYLIGDPTPIAGLNESAQKFNTPGWLQTTDMWLYSSYILICLCIVAALFGAAKKAFGK